MPVRFASRLMLVLALVGVVPVLLLGVDNLRQAAQYLPLERLEPQEASAVLSIPLRQLSALNLLVLVDVEGRALAPTVFSPEDSDTRQRVTDASLALPVKAAIQEVREELQARGVAVSCEIAESVLRVLGHADQFQKAAAHLVQNALTAMPDGGSLTVGLTAVEGDAVCLGTTVTIILPAAGAESHLA